MPRNTFILVSILAIAAALIVGVNTGRSLNRTPTDVNAPAPKPSDTMEPDLTFITYRNTACGISFSVPEDYRTLESSGGSTLFINMKKPGQSVSLLCQEILPPVSVASGSASRIKIGTVSAILSTETSSKESPINSLDLTHPGKRMDIRISAPKAVFEKILESVTLL